MGLSGEISAKVKERLELAFKQGVWLSLKTLTVLYQAVYFLLTMLAANCLFMIYHLSLGFSDDQQFSLIAAMSQGFAMSLESSRIIFPLACFIALIYYLRFYFETLIRLRFFIFAAVYCAVFADFIILWTL